VESAFVKKNMHTSPLCVHRAQYNPIHEFPYNINGQAVDMVFTSVAGHLMEVELTTVLTRRRQLMFASRIPKLAQIGPLVFTHKESPVWKKALHFVVSDVPTLCERMKNLPRG
jgi:hypothetical protein